MPLLLGALLGFVIAHRRQARRPWVWGLLGLMVGIQFWWLESPTAWGVGAMAAMAALVTTNPQHDLWDPLAWGAFGILLGTIAWWGNIPTGWLVCLVITVPLLLLLMVSAATAVTRDQDTTSR